MYYYNTTNCAKFLSPTSCAGPASLGPSQKGNKNDFDSCVVVGLLRRALLLDLLPLPSSTWTPMKGVVVGYSMKIGN